MVRKLARRLTAMTPKQHRRPARRARAAVYQPSRPLVLLGVASVLMAACSGPEDPPGAETGHDQGSEVRAFDPIEGMEASTNQRLLPPEELAHIFNAEQRLIAACMSESGFDFPVTPLSAVVANAPLYLSPSELRRSGYQYDWAGAAEQFLELNGPGGPPDPTAGMSTAEAAAYSEALSGSSPNATVTFEEADGSTVVMGTGGCVGDARAQLYGSVENAMGFERAAVALGHSGLAEWLQAIEAYQAPLASWQQCMREAGYDVSGRTDYGFHYLRSRGATALAESGPRQGDVTEDVIVDVADTDATCQESSRLYDVRQELLPAAQEGIASELGFEMSQYVSLQHAVLERAEQVPQS